MSAAAPCSFGAGVVWVEVVVGVEVVVVVAVEAACFVDPQDVRTAVAAVMTARRRSNRRRVCTGLHTG